MAVDSPNAFRNVDVSKRQVSLPPGDLITTDTIAQQLQITDQEALQPGRLGPFLAGQLFRLQEIISKPEIKALSADIPEYLYDERAPVVTALSSDEQIALGEWRNEAKAMLSSQSGSPDDLAHEIEKFVDDALKNNPDALAKDHSLGAVDLLGEMMTGELYRETAEAKREFEKILATATDAESVILAMTMRQSHKTSQLMGRAFEALKFNQDGLMKLEAEMALKGGSMKQADMMKTNMDFARFSSDSSQIHNVINQAMQQYQQVYTMSDSLVKKADQTERSIIQNMKS